MTEFQLDTAELPNIFEPIEAAAEWLSVHRDELPDPIIPAVKNRFALSNIGAIEALRRARVIRYAQAV